MGWADCGTDSQGRPIGYAFPAVCDHPGCEERIDRGIAYVCGDMHGEDEVSCEKYFCENHKRNFVLGCNHETTVCDACARLLRGDESWRYDKEEGAIVEIPVNAATR